jgi:hypothetical protein
LLSPSITNINLSALTASQAVVTDGSKTLASLAYSSAGGTSNLVQRDSSGNIYGAGVNVSGLTASQAVVTDGSKNLASIAYSATGGTSNIVSRDTNGNSKSVNWISGLTSVVSSGATTTLTAASTRFQQLTGSSNQTFQLPDATTLSVGTTFEFYNNSTGTLSVVDNGSNAIATVLAGACASIAAIAVSTSNGSWDKHFLLPANCSYGTAGLTITGTLNVSSTTTLATSLTGAVIATSGVISAGILGVSNGGTGAATLTNHGVLIGQSTSAIAAAGAGTSGQVLMSNGASADPSMQTVPGNSTILRAPTIQSFTSGSGTYSRPSNPSPLYILVVMVGGGGGGSGSGAGAQTSGTAGGDTTFGASLLTATGGTGGNASTGAGGVGGTATVNSPATGTGISGGGGQGDSQVSGSGGSASNLTCGGQGGSSFFGGAGGGGAGNNPSAGQAAGANSGSGGGGGGGNNVAGMVSGPGGGSGAFVQAIITAPSSTYSYAVGAGGSAGAAGNSGQNGGAGAAGRITVYEYYA